MAPIPSSHPLRGDLIMDDILVTIRHPGTGDMTAALPLEALPAFIDEHLAQGQWAIAESGEESLIVRVGKHVLEFFRGRRTAGQPQPKEEVTILNKMAGGSEDAPPHETGMDPDTMGQILAGAGQGRRGGVGGRAYSE